jgi:hypothetical protein
MNDAGSAQAEFTHGRREKRGATPSRLEQGQCKGRLDDLDRDPWNSSSRTKVQKGFDTRREDAQEQEAV